MTSGSRDGNVQLPPLDLGGLFDILAEMGEGWNFTKDTRNKGLVGRGQ